ncbi:MAG: hypothetical protein ACLT90_18225 [Enterococcus raffinosus]
MKKGRDFSVGRRDTAVEQKKISSKSNEKEDSLCNRLRNVQLEKDMLIIDSSA